MRQRIRAKYGCGLGRGQIVTAWQKWFVGAVAAPLCLVTVAGPVAASPKPGDNPKLDRALNDRAHKGGSSLSRVIVVLKDGADASDDFRKVHGRAGRNLPLVNGQVLHVPDSQLEVLANSNKVASVHLDRRANADLNRAAVAIGARAVQQTMGFDGAGVGVAIIDSGITAWHDDLSYQGSNPSVRVVGGQRVVRFVDFVNGQTTAYDDFGHGTHVAGIVAGNGFDTAGARAGVAPGAHLVSLKVLDANGGGYVSDVIAGLDWAVSNRAAYNIRVINLSVGAGVTESYWTDPLTVATKRAVDAGIVVVAAAGNMGKTLDGEPLYGGISAPGNAPWVLTVGANSDQGTVTRTDDIMADYSSRGPTAIDFAAKPDVVAPGTGIVSLSVQGSSLATGHPQYLLAGTIASAFPAYLSLSGTSMAAPMVAGTAALMMQANPKLTPNLVKAIIQFTAEDYRYDPLTEGAGFLNTQGAVQLAQFLTAPAASNRPYPTQSVWSQTVYWGNHRLIGGQFKTTGNAWAANIVWGTARTADGDNIVWGTTRASNGDNIVWGTARSINGDNIVWGTGARDGDNIVWGTTCGRADCDNIVWGTAVRDFDNIVWGTARRDSDNIVWGTARIDSDNIVWGTARRDGDNIVWGTARRDADNIVWGTARRDADNIVWGTSAGDNLVWDLLPNGAPRLFDDPTNPKAYDGISFDSLFSVTSLAPKTTARGAGGSL